ncbi:CRTAC1 family protein [Fodinibius sediminis]|uniref:Repeat domain-containing protein n=1 Tax=Fodinibius sediminis TaxID=1214077 RepID=A0A521CVP5_9BACT|nr:CRTAC1 family protein [Fodinibius sediminis]SMO63493.1 Repeat domain-containing protein [Fodinibius sediminis]
MEVRKRNKILLALFFAVLLATPLILSNYEQWTGRSGLALDRQNALDQYGFYLEDVTEEWGVDFVHRAPSLDKQLDHIMPQIASVGASVSVADFNNDGLQDFYVTNSARGTSNALYKNLGDGQFEDVAGAMGVAGVNTAETGVSMSSVWADYDNDGYEDLLVVKWGKPLLFHNDEGEGFSRVSLGPEFPEWINSNTAVWFDYDQDGLLDLFMGGYFHESINLWDLETTEIMPESFEYAQNGGRKFLFHNLGNGKFEEVSDELGLVSNRWSYAAASADVDGSGYPDLVIANDYGVDELFLNRQGRGFVNAGEKAGMGFAPKSGMNVSFGDVMNRGELSIYVTNISEPGVLIQGNNLWVPTSGNSGGLSFRNLAGNFGVEVGGWSYGAQFGDLNLDGYLDLYVANGYVSARKGTDYWYDFSKVAGGNQTIISNAKNWPDMEGRSLSGYQENKIWLNDGAGKFREVAGAVGGSLELDSRAVAMADLNNDGTLEVLVATQKGPLKIYRTVAREGHSWISFRLEGVESNRSAIGARVEVVWDGNRQVQVVQSASGFSAQNQRELHFGLGRSEQVDHAVIAWPSGKTDTLEQPETGQTHLIKETKKQS